MKILSGHGLENVQNFILQADKGIKIISDASYEIIKKKKYDNLETYDQVYIINQEAHKLRSVINNYISNGLEDIFAH